MLKSILGTKEGMTQVFDQTGNLISVTVILAGPCVVTDIKTKERDGYDSVQLGFGEIKEKALSRPQLGQFKKKNITPKRYLREFRVKDTAAMQVGQEIKVDMFHPGDYVDVTGTSIGRGYAGAVKRHGFKGGPSTHGQSDRQRAVGSIGDQGHQHVTKGHRMPGRLGFETVTVQKLKVIAVEPEKNVILLEGSVPGVKNGLLVVANTLKKVTAHKAAKPADKKKGKEAPKKK
ncbi:MAG TPA: 50S ribosomal protein L3 [Elusimicrobia bacterium]|nr:MAG: 50S ribosomal protein L3 [Elusimicrobia bacterium RIFOXYA12_FULL_49_49]OGS06126.1 MAG: 50S ribosomal protein L3 [Elusimicrobia bacterium RIFOXYA1_FULL_47_7]OGS09456.1 MAG: 50S ribosomal protein L3 [Elusimicrobia bacterium RIFOXYB1_FULL_48_9]OGS14588.1 MAG: 50S ribosomal protein L3 [Elusimicrobia bacterium RIFOXYA2_FULL_47_53]OGS31679.1 MAG: 50S ribosomal protein L3 [Elusimicrobia bacterium RIFOXYB2_FULL_46_23]HBU69799.1 50S ribosomal protein L3 [Elusimicrobiota bacterium]